MRPRPFDLGRPVSHGAGIGRRRRFNEAQAFRPGKGAGTLARFASPRCRRFNEAQAFRPGKVSISCPKMKRSRGCFNEAQAFRHGKGCRHNLCGNRAPPVSMRPRPFDMGRPPLGKLL